MSDDELKPNIDMSPWDSIPGQHYVPFVNPPYTVTITTGTCSFRESTATVMPYSITPTLHQWMPVPYPFLFTSYVVVPPPFSEQQLKTMMREAIREELNARYERDQHRCSEEEG